MNRAISIAKLVLILCGAFACGMVGAVCVQVVDTDVPGRVITLLAHTDALEGQIGVSVGGLNATLDTLNRPCGGGKPCGTLAEAGKVMVEAGDLVKQSQLVEGKELRTFDLEVPELFAKAGVTLTNLNTATADLHPLITEATARTHDLAPVETDLAASLLKLNAAVGDADTLFTNPDIPRMLNNGQVITANFGATTSDFQTKFHLFLFPAPCRTFGCKLARTWPYIRDGAQMVEPIYWGQQLFQNRVP